MNKFGFRIAIRLEGDYVNAYCAKADTLDDAIYLGNIHKAMVKGHDEILNRWMELIAIAFSNVSFDMTGLELSFAVSPVPEHERKKQINYDIS